MCAEIFAYSQLAIALAVFRVVPESMWPGVSRIGRVMLLGPHPVAACKARAGKPYRLHVRFRSSRSFCHISVFRLPGPGRCCICGDATAFPLPPGLRPGCAMCRPALSPGVRAAHHPPFSRGQAAGFPPGFSIAPGQSLVVFSQIAQTPRRGSWPYCGKYESNIVEAAPC